MHALVFLFLTLHLAHESQAHSLMSYPRPTAAKACRLGGVPARGGVALCPGPCDVSALRPPFPHITSPERPAITVSRGETLSVKYQRNNHGPGGFVRHTLVPIQRMMNKTAHQHNAFHYSCWGANPTVATEDEKKVDKYGFSLVGGDGKLHDMPVSYYVTNITIPDVVPDGVYVLGWTWYGGMGGSIQKNLPENPHPVGLFADYWSCSFVQVKGGARLGKKWRPVFEGGMEEVWGDACMAANDRPGVCVYEPCRVEGRLRKPWEFEGGMEKDLLTPVDFEGVSDRDGGPRPTMEREGGMESVPTPVPMKNVLRDASRALGSCKRDERSGSLRMGRTGEKRMEDRLKKVLVDLYHCKERVMQNKKEAERRRRVAL